MKTGDYMIHVSILYRLSLVLNYLTLLNLIRCTLWPEKISNAKTGKFLFSFENTIYEVFLVWSEIPDPTVETFQFSYVWILRTFSDTINPVITVDVCGETKYTSAKKDVSVGTTTPVNWREHLFFEPRNRVSLDSIFAQICRQRHFCPVLTPNFPLFSMQAKSNRIQLVSK